MTKFIFVTGGVVSSLGKGITAASLGHLLKARGYSVMMQKMDPYLNVDPGTMSPFQHGEVFVTEDGHECDLDLGHYERFIDENLLRESNFTQGSIYQELLSRERHGDFLGGTIQVIPHVTDAIKAKLYRIAERSGADFVIAEIGGTVGDIESQPFIEAARQFKNEQFPGDVVFVHCTLVPYIAAAHEIKTKPTQHSVKQLQQVGIQPDVLVLRSEMNIPEGMLRKVAQFCNVSEDAVVQSVDAPSIYEVPLMMHEQKLDNIILQKTDTPFTGEPDLRAWNKYLNHLRNATKELTIGLVGKYVELQDAYKSIDEALLQAATYCDHKVKIQYISSERLTDGNVEEKLSGMDGVIVAPGFGQRGTEGKYVALKWCRTHDVPTFGICLGMQSMVVEFARNVLGMESANSAEMDPDTPYNVIDLMEEQKSITYMGGTMRLGSYACHLKSGTKVAEAYGCTDISERHRHRYEFNEKFRAQFEAAGMMCVGENPETHLVEVVEIPTLKWYVGTQYHPEYSSTVLNPHPLFMSFVKAAIESMHN